MWLRVGKLDSWETCDGMKDKLLLFKIWPGIIAAWIDFRKGIGQVQKLQRQCQ